MELSPTVWVALIGALASVIAAICAVVAAMRSARLKAEADLVLERFRAEDSRRRQAFETATREAEPVTKALVQVWNDIQAVRDVIYKTVSPALYDEAAATETLRTAVAGIAEGYGHFGSVVPPEAAQAWHDAKSRVHIVEALVLRRGTAVEPKLTGGVAVEERLLSIRSMLRDDQAVLQQSMLGVRARVMQRILETM